MCEMFGGPSQAEYGAQQATQGLGTALNSAFNQQYAQQQQTLGQLNSQIYRIQTGQTGPGYSGAENAALQSSILNAGAARARNAIQGVRERGAGSQVVPGTGFTSGTGGAGLTKQAGINAQVAGGIEAMAGADTANALIGETAANYAQGRTNATAAASGLQALQGDYNPSGYAQQYASNLNQQFSQAKTINDQQIARSQAIAGLVTKAALSAATFGVGGIGAMGAGESFGEGASDFFSGGMNALAGTNFGINGPSAPQDISGGADAAEAGF